MDNNLSHASNVEVHGHSQTAKFPEWVEWLFGLSLAIVMCIELVVLFGNIGARVFLSTSFEWSGEVAELALVAIAFIGGAIGYHKGTHVAVRYFVDKLPAKGITFANSISNWAVMAFGILSVTLSIPTIASANKSIMSSLGISGAWPYVIYAVGMFLVVIFAVKKLTLFSLRTSITSLAAMLGFLLIVYVFYSATGPWVGGPGFLFLTVMLFAIIALGVPIGFVLPLVGYLFLMTTGAAPIAAVPGAMAKGIGSFIFLAIPFFILAGDIMTEGGLTKPLAKCADAFVGHLRGGLLHVLVVSMIIFSGISGSKIADVAAVGTAMRDMLKKQGYKPEEYTALFGASAIMGETIPPSMPLLVLPSITALSVGAFFVAGVIPALFIALLLMIFVGYKARKENWPVGMKAPWGERIKTFLIAIPVLLVPIMLIIGIVFGIATPTETSSVVVVYAIIVALLGYKSVRSRDMVKIFGNSGLTAGMILFIISAGSSFSWLLTSGGISSFVFGLFALLGGSKTLFLLATVLIIVLMGGILEGLPALLIFAPLLMPIALNFGIDPIQYGIVMIFAVGTGAFMPPWGVGFFVCCSVCECTMEQAVPKYIPYLMVIAVGIVLVTFIPELSLWLPRVMHLVR